MNVSTEGVNLIKGFEGFRSAPYRDSVGVWTIGYGHTEGVNAHSKHLTEHEGAALLQHDLDRKYAPPVNALHLPLNQHQFDAVVSLVYNLGAGILAPSHTIGAALRKHDWRGAANAFLLYDKAGGKALAGLTRRRHAEKAMFEKPVARPHR